MVSPSNRRRAVRYCVEEGLGQTAAACRALGLARSTYYRGMQLSVENRALRQEILTLSEQHPRYGYRRVTALIRRGGGSINAKRVQRVRREQGLQVSKK